MPGPLAAPIIGAIGSLVGGLLGRSKTKSPTAEENAFGHVKGIMSAASTFGFNPLTLLGSVGAVGGGPNSVDNSSFGQGVSNAAMLLADGLTRNGGVANKLNQYQQQNARLQQRVDQLTIRSPVPGLYGRSRLPSDPAVYGDGSYGSAGVSGGRRADGASASVSGSGLPDLLTVDPADPRREVEQKPVPTGPGVMVVDNPYVGRYYFPTIDGDEPVDLLDLPAMAIALPQVGYNFGNRLTYGGGRESRPNDKFWIEHYKPKTKPKPRPKWLGLKGPTSYSGAWVQ